MTRNAVSDESEAEIAIRWTIVTLVQTSVTALLAYSPRQRAKKETVGATVAQVVELVVQSSKGWWLMAPTSCIIVCIGETLNPSCPQWGWQHLEWQQPPMAYKSSEREANAQHFGVPLGCSPLTIYSCKYPHSLSQVSVTLLKRQYNAT